MFIERVQVDEGFLDGLDVELVPGFNVIIGARGTGKTSLIELIRFCLGAQTFTEKARAEGPQQAVSVLGGGVVSLTVSDGTERFVVSRQATDAAATPSVSVNATVLAQSEIEAVGARDAGRMHLLDRCRPQSGRSHPSATTLISQLKSLTIEIRDLLLDIADLEQKAATLAAVAPALAEALNTQKAALASAEASAQQQAALQRLQDEGASLSAQLTLYSRTRDQLSEMKAAVEAAVPSSSPVEAWSEAAGAEDLLAPVRVVISAALTDLSSAQRHVSDAEGLVLAAIAAADKARSANETSARELRGQLNALQEGFTQITRRVSELQEKQSQFATMTEQVVGRRARLASLWAARREAFDGLDALRSDRFAERRAVVDQLNRELGPSIRIELTRSARSEEYAAAIQATLRGSGLHHSTLAPLLASELSPLELVQLIEAGDAAGLASTTGIPEDRAASVIAHVRGGNTAEIVAAPIEDGVAFELLDGADYKPTERLSIGQRCTVVLPVLLSQPGDVLVIDQPEDHLDNAFVATTLVERLRKVDSGQQVIMSSHNANIPVLGEASWIIHLDSNGRRGFVKHAGDLDDPRTVEAVTSVMEGGVDAFKRRAEFYGHLAG